MQFTATPIHGAMLVHPEPFDDPRGRFLKFYHDGQFAEKAFNFKPAEEFLSISHRGVIRGMHCQLPPVEQHKLVYCLSGRILDVILDLRVGSPTFRQWFSVELAGNAPKLLLIPAGIAHGFLSLEDDSTVLYCVTSVHDPARDGGVRWDSFGMNWPCDNPIISERDSKLPDAAAFKSPFVFAS
jgi:dTDP-4-dehydrorhamnose 3,5-epimerase